MLTARESRAALQLLTGEAVGMSSDLLRRLNGSPEVRRAALLDGIPGLIDYYSDGSAALAADFYEEQRELAGLASRFSPEAVVLDRTVKIRRGIAWASEPLFEDDLELSGARMAEIVQLNTARPFRDTILSNRQSDPAAIGWKRITAGGCPFCRALASRGATYREATAQFAAHRNCHCTAAPVFRNGETGPEASAIQYMASRRNRTPGQRQRIREWVAEFE
jgi:hypothetical protein